MFRFSNQLQFPALNLTEDFHTDKSRIYSLDWYHIDNVKKKLWENTRQCSPSTETFQGTIPVEYTVWTDAMRFAIPQGLLEEIRHCSLRASEEWDRRKPEIRWEPLPTRSPAVAYIQKAFNILADCLYDNSTRNYSRDGIKSLVPYALAYRFWCHQTKVDNLLLYTGIDDLKISLGAQTASDALFADNKINASTFTKFLDEIEKHIQSIRNSKKVEKAYANEITAGTLKDFIMNKKASVCVNDTVINFPDVGKISLSQIKLSRSKGITLKAELGRVIPPEYAGVSVTLADGFILKDESCEIEVTEFTLVSTSGTPPPIATIRIDKYKTLILATSHLKPGTNVYPEYSKEVKKIDKNKIKKNSQFSE